MPVTRSRWLPALILVGGGAAAWLLAQGPANGADAAPSPPPPRVLFVAVAPSEVQLRVRAHGEVQPVRSVDLVAEIAGRVEAMSPALEAGRFFSAGELLVELDASAARLALERSEALLARARAEWNHARARLARLRELSANAIASRAAGEEAEYAERTAEALLREARAARGEAERTLSHTRIHAPFDGRVSQRSVDPGQFVPRGAVLARVHSIEAAEVRLPVPVAALGDLGLALAGGDLEAGPAALLEAQLGARRVRWPARIVRVEGEVSARSQMVHVVARVEEPFAAGRPALAPGLFVEAEISGRSVRQAVVLPRGALRPPDQIWVIDAHDRVRGRRVDVLRTDAEHVIIVGGLERGERVCARTLGVLEGLAVTPIESRIETPLEEPQLERL